MLRLGLPELIVIFLAVILLFGAKALPDIACGIAKAVKNFRKGLQDIGNESDEAKSKEINQKDSSKLGNDTGSRS